jgi:hypothetical protein
VFTNGHDDKIDATNSNSDKVVVNYAMSDNYDLMVASKPNVSANTQVDADNPEVALKFLHACAAVRFLFYKADSDANDYSINHFELKYLYTAATLEYLGTGTAAAPASPEVAISEWKLGDTPARAASAYAWTATEADPSWPVPTATAGAGAVKDKEWFFVIPQELDNTDGDASLSFSYTIGTDTTPHVVALNLEKYKGSSVTWEPGKTYTYNIEIHPETINFTVTCEDWAAGKDDVVIGPIG